MIYRLLRCRGLLSPLLPFSQFHLGLGFLGQGWFTPASRSQAWLAPRTVDRVHRNSPNRKVEMRFESHQSVVALCEPPLGPPLCARSGWGATSLTWVMAPGGQAAGRGNQALLPTWVSGVRSIPCTALKTPPTWGWASKLVINCVMGRGGVCKGRGATGAAASPQAPAEPSGTRFSSSSSPVGSADLLTWLSVSHRLSCWRLRLLAGSSRRVHPLSPPTPAPGPGPFPARPQTPRQLDRTPQKHLPPALWAPHIPVGLSPRGPAMEPEDPRRRHTHQRGYAVTRNPHLNKVSPPGPPGRPRLLSVTVRPFPGVPATQSRPSACVPRRCPPSGPGPRACRAISVPWCRRNEGGRPLECVRSRVWWEGGADPSARRHPVLGQE